MNGNGLSAVSFDAGNTLLYCDPSPSEIYAEHLSRHGRAVSADDVGPVFKSAWAEMQRRTATGRDRYSSVSGGERAWWGGFVREVLRQLDHDAPWEALLEDLYAAFSDSRVWKVFDDTLIALDALEAAGVRRAVISNWDRRLPEILDTLRLTERFEVVTVSSLEGVEKPARGIFERTLDRLGLAADAVLHVGDSPLEDYAGASEAGLHAVLLDRRGLFSETEFRRVASLEELVELVQNP